MVGVVVAVAVPSILSGVGSALRPLAKEVIKGGIIAYTPVSEIASETAEQYNDIVAEAKTEISHPAKKKVGSKTH